VKLITEKYTDAVRRLPEAGKYIIGHQQDDCIVVYQAYKPAIAAFAVENQKLGGAAFSYDRMSWIKPGFLWMMYRCGWASKENQERVLAIWISKADFESILLEAVPTTFKPKLYKDNASWQADLKAKDVRIQWDPDHSPFGKKQERKAIQLGLKGEHLKAFGNKYIRKIDDVTDFVIEQSLRLRQNGIEELMIPIETVLELEDSTFNERLGIVTDHD